MVKHKNKRVLQILQTHEHLDNSQDQANVNQV